MPDHDGFLRTLERAISWFSDHGYEDEVALDEWSATLRRLAESEEMPVEALRAKLRDVLTRKLDQLLDGRKITEMVPGVSRYTIDRVRPELRAELDRRITASADLIRLNRRAAIDKTLQRFRGWTTSIPAGGDTAIDKRQARSEIGKAFRQSTFEERRVAIDQGHKLVANVAAVVAEQSGAIAAEWHSHWRQPGYDYRPDHKERDGRVYAIRGCWAIDGGFARKGKAGYLDDITQPAQEPYCRCFVRYITTLRGLPDDMLTHKGQEALAPIRAAA